MTTKVQQKNRKRFIPFTPAGSCLMHLAAPSEKEAWENLLRDAAHMPYKTKERFQQRGYTVESWDDNSFEVPCPACQDGNRWTREGPAGLCTFCHGTGIHPSREED